MTHICFTKEEARRKDREGYLEVVAGTVVDCAACHQLCADILGEKEKKDENHKG